MNVTPIVVSDTMTFDAIETWFLNSCSKNLETGNTIEADFITFLAFLDFLSISVAKDQWEVMKCLSLSLFAI